MQEHLACIYSSFFFFPTHWWGFSPNSLKLWLTAPRCDSKLSVGGHMPVEASVKQQPAPWRAAHSSHTVYSVWTPSTAWWSCPEEFWWALHCTDSLSLATVKSVGHPFLLLWTDVKCISVFGGFMYEEWDSVTVMCRSLATSLGAVSVVPLLSCVF